MLACLAANGGIAYTGDTPATRLLVGTVEGVVDLARAAPDAPWAEVGRALPGIHISSLLFEPTRGGIFAGVHGSGLYRSMDRGATWELRTQGLTSPHVWTLAGVDRDGVVILYAGTEPAHLFESRDYGDNWAELTSLRAVPGRDQWTFPPPPHIAHARAIAFDPRDSRTMYVGVEQGALLKTTDAGQTWRELDDWVRPDDQFVRDVHRVLVSQADADRICMVGGDGGYVSPDGGETWDKLKGLGQVRIGYPETLLLDPFDDRVMFVAGASGAPPTWHDDDVNFGFARSRDGGETWESLVPRLPRPLRSTIEGMTMHVRPDGFSIFAGSAVGEVFASDDQGEHWAVIADQLPPITQSSHYRRFLPAGPEAS